MILCLIHCLFVILLFLEQLRPPPKPARATSRTRRFRHRVFAWATTASLLILLVSQLLGNAPFAGATVVFAATKPKSLPAHLTYQQFQQLSHQSVAQRKPFQWYQPTTPSPMSKQEQASLNTPLQLPPSAEPPTMQPIKQALSAAFLVGAPGTAPLDLISSDHHLEVQIPAGAFDLSHASVSGENSRTKPPTTPTPGATPAATGGPTVTATPSPTASPPTMPHATISGPLTLVINEQHGEFVGEMNQLGQYQWQMLDAHGHLVSGITLRHPLTIRYHYQPAQITGLDLDPGEIFLNWPDLAAVDRAAHRSTTQDAAHFTNDPATDTLTAQSGVLDNGPFVVSGDPQNQSPPTPNEASVSGNTGQVSYSYPLQLAPAPMASRRSWPSAIPVAMSTSGRTSPARQAMSATAGRSRWAPSPLLSFPTARPGTRFPASIISATASFPTPTIATGFSPSIFPICASTTCFSPMASLASRSGISPIPIINSAAPPTRCNIAMTAMACISTSGTSTRSSLPMTAPLPSKTSS